MSGPPGRLNGFSKPRSRNQLISWGGQIVSLSLFYPCAIALLAQIDDNDGGDGAGVATAAAGLVAAHAAIVLASVGLWYFVESHDPAEPSCWGRCLPDSDRWTTNKYDRIHKKRIEGLDHFCEWLNTSVGRSNYLPFVLLVALGFLQFGIQLAFGLLLLSAWRDEATAAVGTGSDPDAVAFLVAVGALVAVSAMIALMYAMLLTFHTYLGCRGMSTYDYTMEQQKAYRQQRRLEQAQQAHSDAKAARANAADNAAFDGKNTPLDATKGSGAAVGATGAGGGGGDDGGVDAELGLPSTELVAAGGATTELA